jgi:hypothetical protein
METQTEPTVTGTYVYCVMPTPTAAKEPTALGAAIDAPKPVRIVSENGFAAIVSDALRAEYDPSRKNVGAHERVVREAFERGDTLPMRFGTVARDDGAVQTFLREKHEELEKSFEQLHGRAELALKVFWDRDSMLGELLTEDEKIRGLREALAAQPEGEAYDLRIELGRSTTEAMERKRQAEADRIVERLRPKAIEVDVHRLLSDTMVLNASFLVDRTAVAALDEDVSELGAQQRGRLTFKFVGPLPPYSFVKVVVPKEG